jgi:hypothetical protein
MQVLDLSKWVKPVIISLNTNLTFDSGQTCADQGKLGTTVDGITGTDGTTPGAVACGS